MGEIFLAEHTGIAGFAKRVALKRIRPSLASDPSYVQLFLNEARIGSFLNHPNIVHIFDVGHSDDALWLVMEYVDGIDLKRLGRRASLSGHPLHPHLIAAITIEALNALEEAHGGGPTSGAPIIHRDMSPENILIARSGAVKVLDFGLAKWFPGMSAVPSMEGTMIFGKVRYMPPEQLKGHLIDVRADLFSLGVVMYETLRGTLPFGNGNANQVLGQILAGRPPSPTDRRYLRDPELDAIIYRAMEIDAEDRFQTAAEMRDALVRYLQSNEVIMPLEPLRRMLRPELGQGGERVPAAVLAVSADDGGDWGSDQQEPTEIALTVGERCGKCGGPFAALFLDGLIVDRCALCRGVWLDSAEIERLAGAPDSSRAQLPTDGTGRAPLDRIFGSCPSCKIGLRSFEVPNHPASLEVCPRCIGVWFDRGELRLLTDASVVNWLRTVLESVRTSRDDR